MCWFTTERAYLLFAKASAQETHVSIEVAQELGCQGDLRRVDKQLCPGSHYTRTHRADDKSYTAPHSCNGNLMRMLAPEAQTLEEVNHSSTSAAASFVQ